MDDIKLFGATVHWFDDYSEEEKTDTVIGFSSSFANFLDKVEHEFSYVDSISVEQINSMPSTNSLLYVNDASLYQRLVEENSY